MIGSRWQDSTGCPFFQKAIVLQSTGYRKLGYQLPIMALNKLYNEPEILRKVANGDEKAFAELFHNYCNQIGSFIQGLTQDHQATEEIVQEVFTGIWMDRTSLNEVRNFDAYLFIRCRNHTLNHIRRVVSERDRKEAYLSEIGTMQQDEEVNISQDQYELIDQAIKLLPPQQQKVFVLRRQGLKNPEISEQMNLSIESVKKYQHLAVKFVSEFVKNQISISTF